MDEDSKELVIQEVELEYDIDQASDEGGKLCSDELLFEFILKVKFYWN
jgi:hypothetical protein